ARPRRTAIARPSLHSRVMVLLESVAGGPLGEAGHPRILRAGRSEVVLVADLEILRGVDVVVPLEVDLEQVRPGAAVQRVGLPVRPAVEVVVAPVAVQGIPARAA